MFWFFRLLLNEIIFFAFFYRKIHCLTNEFHGKSISHESRSDKCDVGFSSEIYCIIHQLGNEFFLNRMSFNLKENKQIGKRKRKKSQFEVKSSRIGITLKLETVRKLCQFRDKTEFYCCTLFHFISKEEMIHILMYFAKTRQVGLEQELAKYGNQERTKLKEDPLQQIIFLGTKPFSDALFQVVAYF